MVQYNKKGVTMTKAESMSRARAIRTQRTKDKIQSAINILRLYGDRKITVRAISEESGVSKTTVQKHWKREKKAKVKSGANALNHSLCRLPQASYRWQTVQFDSLSSPLAPTFRLFV